MNNPERWLGVSAGLIVGGGMLWALYGPQLHDRLQDLAGSMPGMPGEPAPGPAAAPPPPSRRTTAEFGAAETREAPPAAAAPPTVDVARAAPAPEAHTVPASPGTPDLSTFDDAIHDALAHVFGVEIVEDFLIDDRIIQSLVTTVDSLDRGAIAVRYRAIGPVPELPVVAQDDGRLFLQPENSSRYDLLVSAVGAADMDRVAGVYRQFQPRFERAWQELGLAGTFDERLQAIIEHLLATPVIGGPIELVRPKVLYQFADPSLEALSSGQKLLIRVGPDHAAVIRGKLQELRRALRAGPVEDR